MTAASSGLGVSPGPDLRATLAGAAFFAGAAFRSAGPAGFFVAGVLPAVLAPNLAAGSRAARAGAPLRGGNLLSRGSKAKFTLPASASQARKALNGRRVRIDTN